MVISGFGKVTLAIAALAAFGASVRPGAGVAAGSSQPSFTAAQATKGKAAFAANCAICHGAHLEGISGPALAGKDTNLKRETAKETFTYIAANMPVGNAGGLPSDTYVNIMAFLLQSNGHHPGSAKLTSGSLKGSGVKIGAGH